MIMKNTCANEQTLRTNYHYYYYRRRRHNRISASSTTTTTTTKTKTKTTKQVGWDGKDFNTNNNNNKTIEELIWTFSKLEIEEIDHALEHFKQKRINIIDMDELDFPLSNNFKEKLRVMREDLIHGRGFAIQRGIEVDKYSRNDLCAIYYGIGIHLGQPVSQNKLGHVLGHVFDLGKDANDPSVRLYTTNAAQPFHTDSADLVGLLCIQNASFGGDSQWCSSVRCFEEIYRERKDLAEVLMKPFHVSRKGEIPEGMKATYEIAIFHRLVEENIVLGIYDRSFIVAAQKIAGTPKLTAKQIEALDYLDDKCLKLKIEMRLGKGDIQWLHNHTTFHARSAFQDEINSQSRRHLLRLWLSPPNSIKLPDAFATRFNTVEVGSRFRGGIRLNKAQKLVCALEPE